MILRDHSFICLYLMIHAQVWSQVINQIIDK